MFVLVTHVTARACLDQSSNELVAPFGSRQAHLQPFTTLWMSVPLSRAYHATDDLQWKDCLSWMRYAK